MKLIHNRDELVQLARELGVRPDWHEPDEQGLTARFDGTDGDFDNAGFWPMIKGHGYDRNEMGGPRRGEMCIILAREVRDESDPPGADARRGPDIAAVNVATLLAWASEDDTRAVAELSAYATLLEERVRLLEDTVVALRAENKARRLTSNQRVRPCSCGRGPMHAPCGNAD